MTGGNETRVVGISGSLRDESHTRAALRIALEGAAESGARTELLDLRDYTLPFCDGSKTEGDRFPDVTRLRNAVRGAHGVILATPEYHGSFSGVLKNALDLMGFHEFEGKLVGLVGVAGGALGAVNALNGLRGVGRSLHAWVVPEQALIPHAWREFDDEGRLTNERLEARVKAVGREVSRFAGLHNSAEARAFLEAWETGQPNPGG